MTYKAILFSVAFSLLLFSAFAQTAQKLAKQHIIDSIKMAMLSDYVTRYPTLRQSAFATDIIGNRTVTGELN